MGKGRHFWRRKSVAAFLTPIVVQLEGGHVRVISVGVLHLQDKVVHALVGALLEVPAYSAVCTGDLDACQQLFL